MTFFICRLFSFYEQLKFRAQLSWVRKKFYNLWARGLILIWVFHLHQYTLFIQAETDQESLASLHIS